MNELKKEIEEKNFYIEELNKKINLINETNHLNSSKIKELENINNSFLSENSLDIIDLKNKINELKIKNEKYEKEINEISLIKSQLEQDFNNLEKENEKLLEENENLENKLEEEKNKYELLLQQIEDGNNNMNKFI